MSSNIAKKAFASAKAAKVKTDKITVTNNINLDDTTESIAAIANYTNFWTPRNYMKTKGVCIDDALRSAEWLLPDSGVIAAGVRNTQQKLFESGSLMFDMTRGANFLTKKINYDFTGVTSIAFAFWIGDQYSFDSLRLVLTTDTTKGYIYNNWTKYFIANCGNTSSGNLHAGWNYIKLHKDDFTNTGEETWGNFKAIRISMTMPKYKLDGILATTQTPVTTITIGLGGVYLNPIYETPKFLLNFDDSTKRMFDNGFPYMRQKGIPASIFVCRDHVFDIGGASYMSAEEHDEWYAAGNDCCAHSMTHKGVYTDDLTEAEIYEEWYGIREWLLSRGYTRSADIIAFPNNQYNDVALTIVKNIGYKFGRGRNVGYISHVTPDDMLFVPTQEIKGTTTALKLTNIIDKAILLGSSVSIFTHNIYPAGQTPGTYDTDFTTFKALIDYVVEKRDAGLIEPVTFSQFYERLSNKQINIPNMMP